MKGLFNYSLHSPSWKALPCLTAIACALPPDYAKSTTGNGHADDDGGGGGAVKIVSNVGPYTPTPIRTEK